MTISTQKVLAFLSGVLSLTIIMLILLTAVGQPHQSYIASTSRNQTTYLIRCSYKYSIVHTIMFVLEGLSMLFGIRLCWLVRDVPDVVNESKNIASGKLYVCNFLSLLKIYSNLF